MNKVASNAKNIKILWKILQIIDMVSGEWLLVNEKKKIYVNGGVRWKPIRSLIF